MAEHARVRSAGAWLARAQPKREGQVQHWSSVFAMLLLAIDGIVLPLLAVSRRHGEDVSKAFSSDGFQSETSKAASEMARENQEAWDQTHGVVCAPSHDEIASVLNFDPPAQTEWNARTAHDIAVDTCAPTSGSSTSNSQSKTAAPEIWRCGCGDDWTSIRALNSHQFRTGARCKAVQLPVCHEVEELPADELESEDSELDVSLIQNEFLQCTGEMHYEHFVSKADVQRHKEAAERVQLAQSKAIKKALDGKVAPGDKLKLDAVIDTIMSANDKYRHPKTEEHAQRKRLERFEVVPRRRALSGEREDGEESYMYDIPLEESLQREAFYNPDFAQHMKDWRDRPPHADGSLTSMQDGRASQKHPELGNTTYVGPARLAFCHYYDDVEVTNPIGVARTKHKLGLHYAMLLNVPPHLRSELDVIFLVGVVLKTTQDASGIGEVVQGAKDESQDGTSFGASLRRFNQPGGLTFTIPEGSSERHTAFRGWLLVVAADTLAAAELIGFKMSWGPKVKGLCWQCNAGCETGIHHAASFLPPKPNGPVMRLIPRTADDYRNQRRHYRSLTPGERNAYQASIGVTTFRHAYTRVPLFQVVEYVPRDCMHVELEGNLKVHAYGLLYVATKKYHWFTRIQLNNAIARFPFLRDQPPRIPITSLKGKKGMLPKKNGSISMTSGQMLQFVIHSVEIMRPLMSSAAQASPEWKAWVAHVKYFQALMKMHFTMETVRQLDDLIIDAQEKFLAIEIYAGLWKPKNHFAQHFPSDVLMFGPPRGFWCMRFEAKNQEHKRAGKLSNYKTVPDVVAKFWAMRSGLRLLRKRKRTDTDTASDEGVNHNGMHLTTRSWVLANCANGQQILGQITDLEEVDGIWYARMTTFNTNDVMYASPGDGIPYAKADELQQGGSTKKFALHSLALTLVLPIEHRGRIRFVEQV